MAETLECGVCGEGLQPTEKGTCASCVSDVRGSLDKIAGCWRLLPAMLARPDGASLGAVMGGASDAHALPGGDILVMLGPGAPHIAGVDGEAHDPPAVGYELANWCEDWATLRAEESWPREVLSCTSWLNTRLTWAMSHHPASSSFADDIRRIRIRLENATHTGDRPEHGDTCPGCGGTLQRQWTKHGREDDYSCPRCGRSYTPAGLRAAVLAVIAELQNAG